jgi:hypothetical protein
MPGTDELELYEGGCHCGAIGFAYRTALKPKEWPVRACQCSFCCAHGVLTTSDPNGTLEFFERIPTRLHTYRFGGKTADFLICGECGVYIGATTQVGGKPFGIINVRALQSVAAQLGEPQLMDYGTESPAERMARRAKRWTPIEAQRSSSP